MADKLLFMLNDKYRLAHDQRQWIVQRRSGKEAWHGIAFVGSKKTALRRIFKKNKIWLSDKAIAEVDALPDTFLRFLIAHDLETAQKHPAIVCELERRFGRDKARDYMIEGNLDDGLKFMLRKPAKGTAQRDEAVRGTQVLDDEEMRPAYDRARSEAA